MLNYIAQTTDPTTANVGLLVFVIAVYFLILALILVALWRLFQKAGRAGWQAIVPIYNTYVLVKVASRPGWWLIFFFIPFVNFVFGFIVFIDLAKRFGKGAGFGVFMFLLPYIGLPMLGFGEAQYKATKVPEDSLENKIKS